VSPTAPTPLDDVLGDRPEDDPEGRWTRPKVLAACLVFVLMAGFWAWIFMYELGNKGEDDMPDRLDDLAWTAEADEICAATNARVAELPSAPSTETAAERADVIEEATASFDVMLDDLAALGPTGSSRDAVITAAWIDDYRIFLDDRLRFAAALRLDPDARFLVTEKYGSHVTKPIDRFARVNEMEACMSPGDV
jgi:hypothetical protein